MKKGITAKEFKQVLSEVANMDFNIWGYEGILNLISIANDSLAKSSEESGFSISADCARKRAKAIEEYLIEIGYYNDNL